MPGERVRVYIACSLDGFIAGPGDDLSWLPGADGEATSESFGTDQGAGGLSFEDFMSDVGALLMGRRTYDVVVGFGGAWPYGERPVLVATHRPLQPAATHVRPIDGDVSTLIATAQQAAGEKDVYLDGGNLIRQAMDAGLVDELIVTMAPVLLGRGHALFAGVTKRHTLQLLGHDDFGGGMVQLRYRPLTRHADDTLGPGLRGNDEGVA